MNFSSDPCSNNAPVINPGLARQQNSTSTVVRFACSLPCTCVKVDIGCHLSTVVTRKPPLGTWAFSQESYPGFGDSRVPGQVKRFSNNRPMPVNQTARAPVLIVNGPKRQGKPVFFEPGLGLRKVARICGFGVHPGGGAGHNLFLGSRLKPKGETHSFRGSATPCWLGGDDSDGLW